MVPLACAIDCQLFQATMPSSMLSGVNTTCQSNPGHPDCADEWKVYTRPGGSCCIAATAAGGGAGLGVQAAAPIASAPRPTYLANVICCVPFPPENFCFPQFWPTGNTQGRESRNDTHIVVTVLLPDHTLPCRLTKDRRTSPRRGAPEGPNFMRHSRCRRCGVIGCARYKELQ